MIYPDYVIKKIRDLGLSITMEEGLIYDMALYVDSTDGFLKELDGLIEQLSKLSKELKKDE